MPYYLHTVDNPPKWKDGYTCNILDDLITRRSLFPHKDADRLRVFDDMKTAQHCRQGLVRRKDGADWAPVIFIPTLDESRDWHDRESDRINGNLPEEVDKDGKPIRYVNIPWASNDWYVGKPDDNSYGLRYRHYAHMSRVMPGQVAFTPSEEYGVQNRKIRMTPARYLEKFARYADGSPALSKHDIARYVALVKAHADQQLKLAKTAKEIVAVYMNGPRSCMAHDLGEYHSTVHPVEAYGDSDLAVAYLGDPKIGVSARSVVWPDRQIYTRIYGDDTLRHVLEDNGYTIGDLHGAHLRAIRSGDDYVLPYVDAAQTAGLTADGRRIKLFRFSGGDWDCKQTDGIAEFAERHTCGNCGEEISAAQAEDWGYCESCNDERWRCCHCGEDSFNRDDAYNVHDDDYCRSCYRRLFSRCTECNGDYRHDRSDLSRSARAHCLAGHCYDCSDGHMLCEDCDAYVESHDSGKCVDCRTDEAELADEAENETTATVTVAVTTETDSE